MISVLLCTLDRPELIRNCISSFLKQSYAKFEIIVVDQSRNEETRKCCESFGDERIYYHHVDFTGLSRARNYGLQFCTGRFICLGDDDAEYEKDYLLHAVRFLKEKKESCILCGRMKYTDRRETDFFDYGGNTEGQELNTAEIMRIAPSPVLILPSKPVKTIGGFDEEFGVGAVYGSGEESDVILQLMRRGVKAYFLPEMIVYHGSFEKEQDPDPEKLYKYYIGLGALLKKNLYYRRDFSLAPKFARATLGAYIKYFTGDAKQKSRYRQRIDGFWRGFRGYRS